MFELTVLREEDANATREEFMDHVIQGLSMPVKSLSSKYFYDDRGSELYRRITELDEYYLTRTEKEIFELYADVIVRDHFSSAGHDQPLNIIELGAGDGRKTRILLQALLDQNVRFEYLPVDISRRAMADLFEAMGSFFKGQALNIHGVIGDYLECIQHIVSAHPSRRSAVLFIGSSIGNFAVDDAISFLSQLRSTLKPKDILLLGCDLRKDSETMRRAYSDSKGITRDFNLNLLRRMNRELGTNFNASNFEHLAVYNPRVGAMESYLLSKTEHQVEMKDVRKNHNLDASESKVQAFMFKAFEPLYLECSYKYTITIVHDMLEKAGYVVGKDYVDRRDWFVDTISTASASGVQKA